MQSEYKRETQDASLNSELRSASPDIRYSRIIADCSGLCLRPCLRILRGGSSLLIVPREDFLATRQDPGSRIDRIRSVPRQEAFDREGVTHLLCVFFPARPV